MKLRAGAKIKLDDGFLPLDVHGFELTGFNESWWMGLSVLHTLFAREHNLLCDELARLYPTWNEERLYQTARMIVAALIAKIHTVEWTPAILGTEALDIGMKTNWYGPPSGDWLTRLGIWLTDVHALQGIPKTAPDHHTAPYSLTEDFVTVYRMHPLLPDDYIFYDFSTGAKPRQEEVPPDPGRHGRRRHARHRPPRRALFVRHRPSRRDHAAQLSRGAAALRAERRDHRPRRWSTSSAPGAAACRATTASAAASTCPR